MDSCAANPVSEFESDGAPTNRPLAKTRSIGPFQDIPGWIWKIFLSAWGTLFLIFALFFTTDRGVTFAITIALLFAMMAFGLPSAMAAQGRCPGYKCRGMIATRSGALTQRAAATQILLIPVSAVLGLIAFVLLAT